MTDPGRCQCGDWVEIESVLLEPAERASGLPPETAEKPLVMWVKGFARDAVALGDELRVETMTGRMVTGRLSDVNPGYFHTFGKPESELVRVGRDLRVRLSKYRAGTGSNGAAEGGQAVSARHKAQGGGA